jgi:hypothetical protein
MAEHVPSQANFIGWLALGLLIFALVFALVVTFAGISMPPS